MGGWHCSFSDVPGISSYEEALAHYEAVDIIVDYGPNWKPIKNKKRRENMLMRKASDGSIVFRFYHTDCVTYRPDGECIIQGYASMSTNSFINTLSPPGVYHEMGQHACEPILYLFRSDERWGSWDPETRTYTPNNDALVIRANQARLHYCAEAERWLPVDPDELTPFEWRLVTDRGAARRATRAYNLPEFVTTAPAIHALHPVNRFGGGDVDRALDHMRKREFREALAYCKQGETNLVFGKPRYGHVSTPTALAGSFVDRLRAGIYMREGLLSSERATVLTRAQYLAYKRAEDRF